jgi:hypothetical protein
LKSGVLADRRRGQVNVVVFLLLPYPACHPFLVAFLLLRLLDVIHVLFYYLVSFSLHNNNNFFQFFCQVNIWCKLIIKIGQYRKARELGMTDYHSDQGYKPQVFTGLRYLPCPIEWRYYLYTLGFCLDARTFTPSFTLLPKCPLHKLFCYIKCERTVASFDIIYKIITFLLPSQHDTLSSWATELLPVPSLTYSQCVRFVLFSTYLTSATKDVANMAGSLAFHQ